MIGWSTPPASAGPVAVVTTEALTSGAVSPGRLGEFQMEEGHAYVLHYRLYAMRTNGLTEQKGAASFKDFIYTCRWPAGGDPSADELGAIDQGLFGAFDLVVVNAIEQVDPETLGRVWIESEGVASHMLAWRVDVYVLSDREIAA